MTPPAGDATTVRHMLARMPASVRATFTDEQVQALVLAFAAPTAHHWIDFRASTRWVRRGIYVRVLVGEERRNRARLRDENQVSLGKTILVAALSTWLIVTSAAALCVLAVYLIKSFVGFDLLDGPSPLHRFFFD